MNKALLLSALLVAGAVVALAPTASALNCTQHVDIDSSYSADPHDVGASAGVSVDPLGLAGCARDTLVIHP